MSRRLHERFLSRARASRAERLALSGQGAGTATALGASEANFGIVCFVHLFAMFYIGITAASVTHRELLLETPVTLPLFRVDVPLTVFFTLAPIVFLILHAFVLAQWVLLSARIGRFTDPLARRDGGVGSLLKAIAFCVLVLAPVLLLVQILVQFLPYHDEAITWLHRIAILADVCLLWLLWPAAREHRVALAWPNFARHGWTLLAGLVPIGLAFTAATFPGEWLDDLVGRRQWNPPVPMTSSLEQTDARGASAWTLVHDLLFHGEVDAISRRRKSLFSNTLELPGFVAAGAAKGGAPNELDSAGHMLVLRGRRLEGAVLIGADLRRVDLTGASLEAASLDHADLQGAVLEDARLQGARLAGASLRGALLTLAQLQGATLDGAQLQGASLVDAQLRGASLKEAQLQDAALTNAQLQGASLPGARLGGATLDYAQLQGTRLDSAELQGASLDHAHLQGAALREAQLQGASLLDAQLQGALLDRAELQGASLIGANLEGASLARAGLQGASLKDAQLRGSSLDHARLQGAILDYAQLQGASLREAQLQGASFRGAQLVGTSLENANIWRASFAGASLQAVFEAGAREDPSAPRVAVGAAPSNSRDGAEPGDAKDAFAAMKALILHDIPKGQKRDGVLGRIARLDPDAVFPETGRGPAFDSGRVDKAAYQKVLAEILVHLACSGEEFDLQVVRGLLAGNRIDDAGSFAPEIVDALLEPGCPVAAAFTEADLSALRKAATAGAGPDPARTSERPESAVNP